MYLGITWTRNQASENDVTLNRDSEKKIDLERLLEASLHVNFGNVPLILFTRCENCFIGESQFLVTTFFSSHWFSSLSKSSKRLFLTEELS